MKRLNMKTLRILAVCTLNGLAISSLVFGEGVAAAVAPAATTAFSASKPVAPLVASAPATITPAVPASTADESIEISYIEADIQNVLRTLAAKAGVNLILGEEVTGKVTVNLKGVSYEEAMRLIAESKGYAYAKDRNVIRVKSREALETEPVELQVYTLNYAKAEDVKKTLDPVLTKQGKIQVDTRSNTLVLSDTPASLSKLVPLIRSLDTQTPQVMIEAKFVETTKNPRKDLGINWTSTLLNHQMSATAYQVSAADPTKYATDPKTGNNLTGWPMIKNLNGGPWAAPIALLNPGDAELVFSYLNQDTDTELLANPRVVTTDNGKARISIATEYPIPNFAFSEQTASLQINGFEYKDIGIILNVSPRINKDDFITLEVTPEASSSTENATLQSGGGTAVQIPIINTRTATTTVLIKSGNTLAIGGLMREDVSDNYTKVPLMGDMPLLGPLFRSKSLNKTKRDLLIFLTPTIVRGDSQTTGYEKYANGLPNKEVYTNDKWMPRDNAKAKTRSLMDAVVPSRANTRVPTQNFGPE
ncbi:MAG TPA: secretin N-terminal domain-containing protein [Verrucomicrobiae bacterium]|nr:secretin N-terminal domain-containing protein [Verrucomicrobiae bacterium]